MINVSISRALLVKAVLLTSITVLILSSVQNLKRDFYLFALRYQLDISDLKGKGFSESSKSKLFVNVNAIASDLNKYHLSGKQYSDLAYSQFVLSDYGVNKDQLKKAQLFNKKAIELEPYYFGHYVQSAYLLLSNDAADLKEVVKMLNIASTLGPNEKNLALAVLDIYFSNWDKIGPTQRSTAVKYLFSHEKFGINKWELKDLIKSSTQKKTRICALVRFSYTQKFYGCQ